MSFFDENEFLWDKLRRQSRPVAIYGTGDGADKLFALCERFGITVSAVFASDEFVRSREFRGFRVQSLSETERQFGDFTVLLSFAVFRDDMVGRVVDISRRHELYAPDMPLFGGGLLDRELLHTRADEIKRAYSALYDGKSRQVFESVLRYRYTGRIEHLLECETDRDEIFARLSLPPGAHFLDLGAYDGDTALEFIRRFPDYSRITAVEPDEKNFRKLKKNPALGGNNIKMLQTAVWSHRCELEFSREGSRNSHICENGKTSVSADSIDNILAGDRADYIKMDVEGAERQVLSGMKYTAALYSPAMCVSAYHRTDDLFVLINDLQTLLPSRRLYLRHHRYIPAWETNIYAF